MRVTFVDGMYKASRITGPKHNYLGISFAAKKPKDLDVLPRKLGSEEPSIVEGRLVDAVLAGLKAANQSNGVCLTPETIEYVSSDTPDYAAYFDLANMIARVAANHIAT